MQQVNSGFQLRAKNNEVIAVGEAYEMKNGCKNGTESIKTNASRALLAETTE